MGTACTIIAISVTLSQVFSKLMPSGIKEEEKAPQKEEQSGINEGNERIKKQIENFLNYNGSAKGQIEIGDDE